MDYQSENVTLRRGADNSHPVTLQVDVGTGGDVQVQIRDRAGDFFTPNAAEFTISESGSFVMERRNRPETQLVASGDAQFYLIGGGVIDD